MRELPPPLGTYPAAQTPAPPPPATPYRVLLPHVSHPRIEAIIPSGHIHIVIQKPLIRRTRHRPAVSRQANAEYPLVRLGRRQPHDRHGTNYPLDTKSRELSTGSRINLGASANRLPTGISPVHRTKWETACCSPANGRELPVCTMYS